MGLRPLEKIEKVHKRLDSESQSQLACALKTMDDIIFPCPICALRLVFDSQELFAHYGEHIATATAWRNGFIEWGVEEAYPYTTKNELQNVVELMVCDDCANERTARKYFVPGAVFTACGTHDYVIVAAEDYGPAFQSADKEKAQENGVHRGYAWSWGYAQKNICEGIWVPKEME